MSTEIAPVDMEVARNIGDRLGVDWRKVDSDQFRRGLEVEQEHWNTVNGNWNMIAKIALDHLAEIPNYYSYLDEMEAEARAYWGTKSSLPDW